MIVDKIGQNLEHLWISNQFLDKPKESIICNSYLRENYITPQILLFGFGLKAKASLFLVGLDFYFLSTYRNYIKNLYKSY